MAKTKKPTFQAIAHELSQIGCDLAGCAEICNYQDASDAIALVANNLERINNRLYEIAKSLPEEQSGEESHG